MKNFDQFIGVDWSGSKALNTPSIAVASCMRGGDAPKLHESLRSRRAVAEFIDDIASKNKRTLIGIDANFGYNHKVGQQHFGSDYTAFDQWRIIDEHAKEDDNFYAGGFFNHPKFTEDFWQTGKTPDWFDANKLRRATETQCIADGYGHPESPFKICYTKQVGKGGMAAMRVAHYLKQKLGDKITIWPFEDNDGAIVTLTEIYPRQFLMRAGWGTKKVKTGTDLNAVLPYFNSSPMSDKANVTDHDTDALVSAVGLRYLCGMKKQVPLSITHPQGMTEAASCCEGWIFGVGDNKADHG